MKFPMALLVAVGLLGLACSNEPVTREPEPPARPPFGMFLGAWSMVPAGSIATGPSWPLTVIVGVRDTSGIGGVIEAATIVARDADGAVIVEARSTEPTPIPPRGEGRVTLELAPGAAARPAGRVDVIARVRDTLGEVRVLEETMRFPS